MRLVFLPVRLDSQVVQGNQQILFLPGKDHRNVISLICGILIQLLNKALSGSCTERHVRIARAGAIVTLTGFGRELGRGGGEQVGRSAYPRYGSALYSSRVLCECVTNV